MNKQDRIRVLVDRVLLALNLPVEWDETLNKVIIKEKIFNADTKRNIRERLTSTGSSP